MSKKQDDKIPTGLPQLNNLLQGGIKVGDFPRVGMGRERNKGGSGKVSMCFKDPGLLAEGVDTLTQVKTFLREEQLTANLPGKPQDVRKVFVVHSADVELASGLFFTTRTLAEVHFDNITGKNSCEDSESSGGRTLQEMIQYLFHS